MHVLVTGGAGFIGSHLVDKMLNNNYKVTVIDNFDPFYDVKFKEHNISLHLEQKNYKLINVDIRNMENLRKNLTEEYTVVVHLAAKAGVRPSIQDPLTYQAVNVQGTQNMLELARERGIKQFIFGSSSSVYGINPNVPWKEDDRVLMPISPYAATKVSGELLGHVYSHLYGIRFLALRFFTVYGPRQRPDLAINKFARLMMQDKDIPIYGDGTTRRDYTYIDDIVDGISAAMEYKQSLYEVINLGSSCTVTLNELIHALERVIGCKAKIQSLNEQPGDVIQTYADIRKAGEILGYQPKTDIYSGLKEFVQWMEQINKFSY